MDSFPPSRSRFELQAQLFGTYFALYQRLTRDADRELASFGISSRQWLLLAVLTGQFPGEAPTLTDAARAYGTSRQNVRRLAEQLEQKGYVRIIEHTEGLRTVRIELTDNVAAFDTPEALARQAALFDHLFGRLLDDELAELTRLVDSCRTGIDAEPDGNEA